MIRVLLVDDQTLVRAGFRALLDAEPDIEVVGEAVNGADAVEIAAALRPDVVLMDIRMPRLDGVAATRALHERPSPPRVIVLTTFDADDYVLGALAAGADGFLLKDTSPQDLLDAVRAVAAGEPMLSPSVTRTLLTRLRAADPGGTGPEAPDADARTAEATRRLARLTEREHDVAVAVGAGLTNAEIAAALHLSVPTVKAHVSRLFEKLEVTNRVQIAICVHDAGLT